MANEVIYEFKKILQEPETDEETQQIRALKQNFKALNKNFEIASSLRQINLLYVAAIKIISDADGNDIDFDNSRGEGGFTFLHYAVWANAAGLVKTFLHHDGIDVNAQSDAGLTALQLAIIQNSPKILKILLSHPEIDLNLACSDGWTALHLAISYGHEKLIAEILKFKSKVQIDARMLHQITPLQLAAMLDKGNLVKILLENGADAQLTTATGETALKLAEKFKCQNAVEILRMHAAAKILLENSTPKAATCQIAPVTDQLNTLALENRPTINETATSQNLNPNVSKPPPAIYDFSADGVNDAATLQLFCATFAGKVDEMKSLLAQQKIDFEAVHKSGKNIWDFAILNGDPAVIECLLEAKNQEVDLTDLLFKAAKMGSESVVEFLIEIKDLNPMLKHKYQTLLAAAASSGNLALVKYLIEIQNLTVESTKESCPIIEAVLLHDLDMLEYLLAQGGNIDGANNARRPIRVAAEKSNLKVFKYLLEKGADIAVKNGDKGVFDYAAIGGNLDIMLYLVKEKDFKFDANISDTNLNILFQFVRVGSLENIKYLIEVERLEFKNKKGAENGTILHEAVLNKNVEVIKYFVEEHGLNFMARDDKGYVPLFYAVECNNLAVVKYFMEKQSMRINIKAKQNRTALHIAALNGSLDVLRYLVEEKKANINAKDEDEKTPLLLSAQNGHSKVFSFLWKLSKETLTTDQLLAVIIDAVKRFKGDIINWIFEEIANIPKKYLAAEKQEIKDFLLNWSNNNSMANKTKILFDAARAGNLTLIKFLIEDVGMDANVKNELGGTPVFSAVTGNKLEAVKYFVECAEVDVYVEDLNHQNVRAYAASCRHKAIQSYLASKVASLVINTSYR